MSEFKLNKIGEISDAKLEEFAKTLTLDHDSVFPRILSDAEVAQPLIEDLIGAKVSSLTSLHMQDKISIADGKSNIFSVVYDAAMEADGAPFDIELQKTKDTRGPFPRRARVSSAYLDSRFCSKTGDAKYCIPDSYVVFFVCGASIYPVSGGISEFTRQCCGVPLNDGSHIIVVDYLRWRDFTFLPALSTFCAMLSGEHPNNDYAMTVQSYFEDFVLDKEVLRAMYSLDDKLEEKFYNGKAEGVEMSAAGIIPVLRKAGMTIPAIVQFCLDSFGFYHKDEAFWTSFVQKHCT